MKKKGWISPRRAAQLLDVHYNTVRAWCRLSVQGKDSPLRDVRQHVNKYYWISLDEVLELRRASARIE